MKHFLFITIGIATTTHLHAFQTHVKGKSQGIAHSFTMSRSATPTSDIEQQDIKQEELRLKVAHDYLMLQCKTCTPSYPTSLECYIAKRQYDELMAKYAEKKD